METVDAPRHKPRDLIACVMDASRWFEREFNHRNGLKGLARCLDVIENREFPICLRLEKPDRRFPLRAERVYRLY
jgi:hypothetical protein